jgi:hypothetical protein
VIPDPVTFFGPRSTRFGRRPLSHHYFAYCLRSEPDLENLPQDSVDQLRRRLHESLKESGGILVELRPRDETIDVIGVEVGGYCPPKKMLRLPAAGEPEMISLGNEIHYQPGDHFLVPVDADSLARLYSFEELLQFLPLDQERNILDLLRKPQLELRLQLLEWRLANAAPASGRRQSKRWRRWFSKRSLMWWLLGLLATALAVMRLYFMPSFLQIIPENFGGDTVFVVLVWLLVALPSIFFRRRRTLTDEGDGVA